MPPWLMRVFGSSVATRATEGQYRPGPYLLSDGWLPAGSAWNFWQTGQSIRPYGEAGAMVEACISAYAQTVAMCATDGNHWRRLDNGGRERVTTSDLSRILRRPNDYQSISDLLLNLTRRLYAHGEAFAVAIRNNRGEIQELHMMRDGRAAIGEDGSIFYSVTGNEIAESRYNLAAPIPARDVLHIRLHTPRHALKGVSPILATALDLAMSGAVLNQQIAYYLNQARPSFILETDQNLNLEQQQNLVANWAAQTQGENAGKSPLLTWGVKAKPVTTTAQDGQLAELLKMTDANVALAFRIPLAILGVGGTPYASTELLMQSWLASGLGFCMNHIEEAFGLLFRLRGVPDEYVEFDMRALLRPAHKDQIEATARAVISGIYSPDEARAVMDLPAVPGGHGAEPRVQQQVVPLSYGTEMKPPQPSPPASETTPAPDDPPKEDDDEESAKDGNGDGDGRDFADFARQIDEIVASHAHRLH